MSNMEHQTFLQFKQRMLNPLRYRLFLFARLPLAFFVGLKVQTLNPETAQVSVRLNWLNKNPFKSMYFAVLSMAAEFSTGVLAFAHIQQYGNTSMLVTGMQAKFTKKAMGKITFTCENGLAIAQAIEEAQKTASEITCQAEGKDEAGNVVAVFSFTWSFRGRK
jgi:hypothetical protein